MMKNNILYTAPAAQDTVAAVMSREPLVLSPRMTAREALARLRGLARPGDVVLLAPATSSYDQYANYKERGEDFRRAVLDRPAPHTTEGVPA